MLASFGGTLDRRAGAIDIDEEEAMDAVIGYLADLGHERFAFARQHAREAEVDRRPQAFSAGRARGAACAKSRSTRTRRPSAA